MLGWHQDLYRAGMRVSRDFTRLTDAVVSLAEATDLPRLRETTAGELHNSARPDGAAVLVLLNPGEDEQPIWAELIETTLAYSGTGKDAHPQHVFASLIGCDRTWAPSDTVRWVAVRV